MDKDGALKKDDVDHSVHAAAEHEAFIANNPDSVAAVGAVAEDATPAEPATAILTWWRSSLLPRILDDRGVCFPSHATVY